MIPEAEVNSFDTFLVSLSTTAIAKLSPATAKKRRAVKGRKNEIKPVVKPDAEERELDDAADLSDFLEYLAEEIFLALPPDLRTLSYSSIQDDATLLDKYALPLDTALLESLVEHLPPTAADSLSSYGLILPDLSNLDRFLEPILDTYITSSTTAPAEYTPALLATRPTACEICEREQLPLTYHHLIPRQMHAKAVKRGWHKEWELGKVAWLCRACHSYVHRILSNEELAREWFSVEALMEREDVQKWAAWAAKVRWKAR